MKKLTLFSIIISLFVFAGMSQQTGRLDSTLTYRTFSPDYSWDQIYRTIYLPNVSEEFSLLQHDRKELKTAIPDWTRLCDDSIVVKPNLKEHYTIPVMFGGTEYVPLSKEQNTLNPNGSIRSEEIFRGSDDGLSWTPHRKVDFTYHPDGSVASESNFYWNTVDEVLVLGERIHYNYNSDGLIEDKTFENTSNISREFGLSESLRYEYNAASQVVKKEQHFYDHNDEVWHKRNVVNYYYRNDGKPSLEVTTFFPNNQPGEIVDSSFYDYDAQGRISLFLQEGNYQGVWMPKTKTEYTYSSDGLKTIEVKFFYQDGSWDETKREEKEWNTQGDLITKLYREATNPTDSFLEEYFYSYTNTSISPIPTESCTLPNPISANASLNCSMLSEQVSYEISLFDFQGKLVNRSFARKGEQLHFLSGMKQGMYILQISDGVAMISRQKVVLQD